MGTQFYPGNQRSEGFIRGLNLLKVEVKDEEEVHLVEKAGCGDGRNG